MTDMTSMNNDDTRTEQENTSVRGLFLRKINLWLLAWPVGILMYATARLNTYIAEYVYARGIYRVYGTVVSFITGSLPFSLAELLLIVFPIALLIFIVIGIVRIVKGKGLRTIRLIELIRLLLIIAGLIFCWFMIGAGTNYYRYEYAHFSGLEQYMRKSSVEELYELCKELAGKAAVAREDAMEEAGRLRAEKGVGLSTDNTGDYDKTVFASAYSDRELANRSKEAMKKLGETVPVLKGYYPRPKGVFFSRFMSEFNITGVYFPWTVEANVNIDVPDYTIGAALCHELSHLRGFMREDEANFIGYLACVGSDCAELRYSGYMLALVYAGNRLYSDSPEMYRELFSTYSEGMVLDMRAHSAYWKQFEDTVLSEAGEKMNNAYLKANNQSDGTKSYGRMVDLLLAEYRAGRE